MTWVSGSYAALLPTTFSRQQGLQFKGPCEGPRGLNHREQKKRTQLLEMLGCNVWGRSSSDEWEEPQDVKKACPEGILEMRMSKRLCNRHARGKHGKPCWRAFPTWLQTATCKVFYDTFLIASGLGPPALCLTSTLSDVLAGVVPHTLIASPATDLLGCRMPQPKTDFLGSARSYINTLLAERPALSDRYALHPTKLSESYVMMRLTTL